MTDLNEHTVKKINEDNSYRSILRRVSSYGGIQILNILIALIRGKFIALFLGPEGMGISSLLVSSTASIQQVGTLGLNQALVKEVASEKDDTEKFPHILAVCRRLILLTSLLGLLLCLLLSPLLSLWSFGNWLYALSFVFLSLAVAMGIASSGLSSILQGLGHVNRLARATLVGGITGLTVGVPLYYFFGNAGIVPAMIILALATFIFYAVNTRHIFRHDRTDFRWDMHKPIVKRLLSLGLILMLGGVVGTLTNYLINIFVRFVGTLDDVGLFQAANSLTNQYVGIVFSALALDYFPRLSAAAKEPERYIAVMNRQAEIVILILTPLVLALIFSAPIVIKIFLSSEFMSISPLMRWMGLGVLIQGITFPLSYLYIARENRKLYLWLEIVLSNVLWILCSVVFYYYFSLVGLGISLVVRSGIDIFVSYIACNRCYGFNYTLKVFMVIVSSLLLGTAGFLFSLSDGLCYYIGQTCVLTLSIAVSIYTIRRSLRVSR